MNWGLAWSDLILELVFALDAISLTCPRCSFHRVNKIIVLFSLLTHMFLFLSINKLFRIGLCPEAHVFQAVPAEHGLLCEIFFAFLSVAIEKEISICVYLGAKQLLHESTLDVILLEVEARVLKVVAFNLSIRQESMDVFYCFVEVLFVFDSAKAFLDFQVALL